MPHRRINHCALLHVALGINNPACNIDTTRWLGQILAVVDHPLFIVVAYKSLEWLVLVANVDRLHDANAARWDDDNLDAKVVDGAVDRPHFVDAVAVKE